MLDDFDLVQMVNEPTRCVNVLDLFLTSNHTLVQKVEIVPGIADHDIMIAGVNVKPQITQQKPRTVPLHSKADLNSFRKYISVFVSDLLLKYENKTVEKLLNSFKSIVNQGILKFIPIKRFGVKKSVPWITKEIKRLVRKRDGLFQVQKRLGRNRDRHHFKQVKDLIQTKIRSAYDNCLQDLLGLAAQSADESPSVFVHRKLYSLIKNARQDSQEISALINKSQIILATENKAKATILNKEFQSWFLFYFIFIFFFFHNYLLCVLAGYV